MDDLDKKLAGIIDDVANKGNSQGLKGLVFTWGTDYQERIKKAFKDAGYATVTKIVYRDELGREYLQHTLNYADGSGEFVRVPQFQFMTADEWLGKTLRAIHAYQTDRDYFRSDEKFRASTITMGELETLLKKAAGIK